MIEQPGPQVLNRRGQSAFIEQPKIRTERKLATYHVVGENAALRKVDINSSKDIDDIWDIEQSEGMKKWIIESDDDLCKTKGELRNWIRGKSDDVANRRERLERSYVKVYAVTKSDRFPDEPHNFGWTPDVEGWLRVDSSSPNINDNQEALRYKRVTGEELPDSENYPSPVEIAYIRKPKDPNKPKEHAPKLMESAVRQMCHMIAAQDAEISGAFYEQDDITPRRIVMAFAQEGNSATVKVLEAAGFVLKKSSVIWDTDLPDKKSDMYILDWDKFHKLMELNKKEAEKEILGQLANFIPEISAQKMTRLKAST